MHLPRGTLVAVSRDPVSTQTFRLLTPAPPQRVWGVLTCPQTAPTYLHGLSPRTCWSPGASVAWQAPGVPVIPGQVLHADPPYRLSVTVEDSSGTCTYLTWRLRQTDHGTVVRLDVEEAQASAGSADELEEVWLPVLQRLGDLLREPVA
ncbi:MAG: Activator of Hsp90 ATPase 1-like protein [Actinomycetota bacterium]|nr:Activator of Hsp90 ATPase 1-like protein [Actinomycetota bacterium]